MRNLLLASTFFAAFALHAQTESTAGSSTPCVLNPNFARGDQSLCNDKCIPSYNIPAGIKLQRDYNFLLGASYLYWYAGMEGLDLATTAAYLASSNTVVPASTQTGIVFQNAGYTSGYKISLGSNLPMDAWLIRADYTSYRHTTLTHEFAPTAANGIGAFYFTDWFYQISIQNQGVAATELQSKWHLGLDFIDLTMQRPFYQGRKLTFTPYCGLRSSIIRQSLRLQAYDTLNVLPGSEPLISRNSSHAWGIGPRIGIDGHLLISHGFRLSSNFGGSLLFTQYTHVNHSEDPVNVGGTPVAFGLQNFNCIRPMIEANLGAGWGCYLWDKKMHIDLSASYDFNYLWGQNMMRTLNDIYIIGTNSATNDLFLHGLTLNAAWNF